MIIIYLEVAKARRANNHQYQQIEYILTYLDVEEVFCEYSGTLIDWDTWTIELAAKHFSRDWHAENVTCEFDVSLQVIDVWSALENLIDN